MRKIATDCRLSCNNAILNNAETTYGIAIRAEIKSFFKMNNGGYPIKDVIISDGTEYEVRAFLSLDKNDDNYCVERSLHFFLEKTRARIIPVAIDSGDNYYCVNNETGKVYFWRAGSDSYYLIANTVEAFTDLFRD